MSCCGGGSGVTGLCGSCGCSPCTCVYQNIIQQGGSGSPATAGQCVNLSGVCVLDAFTANTMYFRGVDSGSAALTVSLDATNHTILLNLDINAIATALPQATTSQVGVGETATDAEAIAKVSLVNFVTPSNFAAMGASTTFAGLVELSTDAEAITGTSTTLAITPANLAAVLATGPSRQTFADAVGRNAAIPDFIGQPGYQLDTGQSYVGYGVAPGLWRAIITDTIQNDIVGFSFSGGAVVFGNTAQITTGGLLDFFGGQIAVNATPVPADSVLITGAAVGQFSSSLINTFLSVNNTQTYTITNAVTTRTFDAAAATLQNTKDTLATLIQDLQATQKPTV